MEESERENVASRSLSHKRWPFPFRSLCKVSILHLLQRTTSGKFSNSKETFSYWFHVKIVEGFWIYIGVEGFCAWRWELAEHLP